MKFLILPSAILLTSMTCSALAQGTRNRPNQGGGAETAVAPTPNPAAALTEAQVNTVLNQLKELEAQVLQMRGSNLSSILSKLQAAMASDQAAMGLYLDCDRLVNSDRKEVAKTDARKRQDDMEKRMDQRAKGGGNNEEGEFGVAVRLGIHYLVLTLQAHEAKEEDFEKMAPKLQEYIQTLVASAPKLKGRANGYLANALSNNNPIVDAFSLSRYLTRKDWNKNPLDIGSMYSQTLFPLAAQDNKDSLPGLWDARIMAEGTFKKENLYAPEFELWTKNELPAMRWQRAVYLYEKGPSPVNALADMLKVIKDNPAHADAPKWVADLRQLVNHSAPEQTSSNLEPAPGS
ncbi:hypothetical protein WJU23_12410 [Prosthecobacter sp. SYSU 5D2]|uniref:hypothetical protein n=1 Tax=Prosthecobacter sp. SYSU 5D2 TaxID=3134134 RepID=UPI0031FF252E